LIGAASMSTFGKAQTWGSSWKAFIKTNADRWNIAYLQKTTLPYEDNVLDLDPTVKDSLGFPVIRITADHKDNEKKLGVFIQDKMAQWFMEAGAIAVERGPNGTMGPSTHAYGGTRMGDNRETNVVNRFGFSHEVPNLGVLGAPIRPQFSKVHGRKTSKYKQPSKFPAFTAGPAAKKWNSAYARRSPGTPSPATN